ncbi:MAG: hypothetical protein SFU25_04025 [Candidatus Caenarcaniphilales bacterium]|nr:hypothetical protein [Candidatus Caenarcaniphilales bacterium]
MVRVSQLNPNPLFPLNAGKSTAATNVNNQSNLNSSNLNSQAVYESQQKQQDDDDERLIEDQTLRLFQPWKHNTAGFAVDVVFSYLTYLITYTLLKYIRPKKFDLMIKDRIEKQVKPELEIKSELEQFKEVLSKMSDNDPIIADKYWEFFDKHVNQASQSSNSNTKEKIFSELYKLIYGTHRRFILGSTIGVMSLARAIAINPNMPLPLMAFILFGPLLTNKFFDKADEMRRASENSSMPMSKWRLTDSWRKGELFNFCYKIAAKCSKRSQEILEFLVFYAQSFVSLLLPFIPKPKQAANAMSRNSTDMQSQLASSADNTPDLSFEGVVTFGIAIFGSFFSRFFRDFLEDGLPKEKNSNPAYDWIGNLGIVKNLRQDTTFQQGPVGKLIDGDKKDGVKPERGMRYLLNLSFFKTVNKFATDIAIFSLMGIGLLKVAYFFKHMLHIHRKKKDHPNDDAQYTPSEAYTDKVQPNNPVYQTA